eukprot:PITA_14256
MAGSCSMNIIVVPAIIALCCGSSVVARAIASIALAITIGVCLPLLGRATFSSYRLDRNTIFGIRAFVVGLVLATALLQLLLPDAFKSPPSGISSWQNFPFPGLVATFTAPCVLIVEALATGYSHLKNRNKPSDEDKELAVNGKDSRGRSIDEDSRIGHGIISQVLELAIINSGCNTNGWMGKSMDVSRISALFAGVTTGIGMLSFENRPMVVIVDAVFNTGSAGVMAYMCLLDLYSAYFTVSEMQRRGALKIWKYMAILSLLWDSSFLTKWILKLPYPGLTAFP